MNYLDFFNKGKYPQQNEGPFRIGYVVNYVTGDQVKVRLSGETTPVTCFVTSQYQPFQNDKVIVARIDKAYVVIDSASAIPRKDYRFGTADLNKISNTTFSNLPGVYMNLEANAVYRVTCRIFHTTSGDNTNAPTATAPDLKIVWTAPVDTSWLRECFGAGVNATAFDNIAALRRSAHQLTTVVQYGTTQGGSYQVIEETGYVYVGATAGVLQVQAAQNLSTAQTVSVRSASYIEWERVG